MPPRIDRSQRIKELIAGFPHYLGVFNANPPFNRAGQLSGHVETIRLRRNLGSTANALADETFLRSLYQTIQAWGIGKRASRLAPWPDFVAALRANAGRIDALGDLSIESRTLDVAGTTRLLWRLIDELAIVDNNARIVPGSKTLHHMLPDLIAPIDRAYTQKFFKWHGPQFQYQLDRRFKEIFQAYAEIARNARPGQYVTGGWNSSATKVIDNAVVGFVMQETSS